ncbi:hypothetical protein AT705_11305 [Pseudoalteromonas rubra]|uniref:Uncharacterized protein n=1 Tax=Pseudoalteromonas rubra TaxID=43658 RepID=A0A0U3I8P5_9GAMM|nr:hypothetical protein AT705_11305 [Pseudoalteromonas rubra]
MRDGRRYKDALPHRIFHRYISGIKKGRLSDLFHSVTAICRLFYDCSYKHLHYPVEGATYRAKG